MKQIFPVFLFLLGFHALGQQFLVPVRIGTKTGLCDENKKVVIAPAYDEVTWLEQQFFQTGNKLMLQDTIQTPYHKAPEALLGGIIYRGKEILKNEPFQEYTVSESFVIGEYRTGRSELTPEQYDNYHTREQFDMLFNLKGEKLTPQLFKRIQVVDRITDPQHSETYVTFVGKTSYKQASLFVYDSKRQKITAWLLKDVEKISFDRCPGGTYCCTYLENGSTKKMSLTPKARGFVLETIPMTPVTEDPGEMFFLAPEGFEEDVFEKATVKKDTVYRGDYFIAKDPGTGKYGLTDDQLRTTIPFEYDSMLFHLQITSFVNNPDGTKRLFFHRDNPYVSYTETASPYWKTKGILVYRNGKAGILSPRGQVLLPVEYDMIVNAGRIGRKNRTGFILLKKNGLYGTASSSDFQIKTPPVFQYIPGARYSDYYGINGLYLYELYDEQARFMGFGDSKGGFYAPE